MNAMFKDAADKRKSGLEKSYAIGEAYYEFYKRHPHYFRMLMEAENLLVATSDDVNAAELMKASRESLKILSDAVVLGIKDGSIKPDLDPIQTSIFLIQSTRSMILLPPGFEIGSEKGERRERRYIQVHTTSSAPFAREHSNQKNGELKK